MLALRNLPGLCVITTRLAVADIAAFQSAPPPRCSVSTTCLRKRVRSCYVTIGVHGSDTERRAASQEFGGHALALHLLGPISVMRVVEMSAGGKKLPYWMIGQRRAVMPGVIMESYERWFGPGPEVAVLRMLGLFDRMANEEKCWPCGPSR